MSDARDLTTGPLLGHFRALGIPAALGMVFNTLYNVVDVYFAGLVSTDAQAGLAIAFQVFFLTIALGFGLGTGLGALIGNAIGAGEERKASEYAAQGLVFAFALSCGLGVVVWVAAPFLLNLIGASGAYYVMGLSYVRVLAFGAPMFLMAFAANGVLSSQGDTKSFQRALAGSFFANLILNPLFVFGLGPVPAFGFNGIALATLASQTGVVAWVLWRAVTSPVLRACRRSFFRPRPRPIYDVAEQGFPASFNMIVMMLGGFIVQFYLQRFGPGAVAGYGVALRLEQIVLLPGFGVTAALLPIVAQNFGASDHARVRAAFWLAMKIGVTMMLVSSALIFLFGRAAMTGFSDDPEVIAKGRTYLQFTAFLTPVYFTMFAMTSFMQGLKKPFWPVAIGVYRQFLALALFGALYVLVLDLGLWGVWFAIASAVTTGFLVSWAVTAHVARGAVGGLLGPRALTA